MNTDTSNFSDALSTVVDPIFEKTLGELGSLSNLRTDGDQHYATVRISSPSEAVREELQRRIERALKVHSLPTVQIEWDIQVPTRETVSNDPLPEVRNVILVMSGKGGVGKSTVAANLALALGKAGARVGLLDADIYGPSVPTMFGIAGHPSSEDGKRIVPLQRFGIKLMSIGFILEDPRQAVVWRGPMVHGALQQFLRDVAWGPLDYLVLDLPPGTGDVALTLSQQARITGVVVVTTPQEVALQDVYKSVSMCHKVRLPILGVVENMSYFLDDRGMRHELFGSGGGQAVAEYASAPLLGQVPIEPSVREWGDRGTPVVQSAPNTPAAQALNEIADQLATLVAQSHFERHGSKQSPPADEAKRLRVLR